MGRWIYGKYIEDTINNSGDIEASDNSTNNESLAELLKQLQQSQKGTEGITIEAPEQKAIRFPAVGLPPKTVNYASISKSKYERIK